MTQIEINEIAKQLDYDSTTSLIAEFLKTVDADPSKLCSILDYMSRDVIKKFDTTLPKFNSAKLRIYKNLDSNSILTINFDAMKFSTISSYHASFLHNLNNGSYSYFSLYSNDVKSVDQDKIIFSEKSIENFTGFDRLVQEQTFVYIGDASNTDELLALLS